MEVHLCILKVLTLLVQVYVNLYFQLRNALFPLSHMELTTLLAKLFGTQFQNYFYAKEVN